MKNILETILQFVFCIVMFVFTFLVTLGIRADFSILETTEYWIQVSISTVLMIFVYNMIYIIDQRNRSANKNSRFYIAFQTVKLRTDQISKNHLYEKLEQAVQDENEARYKNACNAKLQKLTSRFGYDEIIGLNEEEFMPFLEKYLIREKSTKRFCKLFKKIKEGKIKIRTLQAENLMQDKELGKANSPEMLDYSDKQYETKRNIFKIVSFIGTSVIMSVISFVFTYMNFWQAFLTNTVLFFGSAISGFYSSIAKTNFKTNIYENRNTFFERRLGITDKFIDSSAE